MLLHNICQHIDVLSLCFVTEQANKHSHGDTHKLYFLSSSVSLLITLSLSISEEDLMKISLWVGECKTNTSLDLVSLCALPWRGKCGIHEKAARQTSNTVFWHLHCLLSSHQILSCPVLWSSPAAWQMLIAERRDKAERETETLLEELLCHPADNSADNLMI